MVALNNGCCIIFLIHAMTVSNSKLARLKCLSNFETKLGKFIKNLKENP